MRDVGAHTRAAIESSRDVTDADAAVAAWEDYPAGNPEFVVMARRTIDQILTDP